MDGLYINWGVIFLLVHSFYFDTALAMKINFKIVLIGKGFLCYLLLV